MRSRARARGTAIDQRGLADARRRAHQRDRRAPRASGCERCLELRELGLAAGEPAVARDADHRAADPLDVARRRAGAAARAPLGRSAGSRSSSSRAQLVEIARARRAASCDGRGARLGLLLEQHAHRRAFERQPPGQRLEQHDADRVPVRRRRSARHRRRTARAPCTRRCRRSAVGAVRGARARRPGRSRAARRGHRS